MRLLALLFCTCASLAQAAGLTVQTLDIKGKNNRGEAYAKGQMTMPLVKAKQTGDEPNAKIAKKINDRLSFIDTQGNESQRFTVSRNDDRILTIAFDNEGCGAYCENYSTWYSFDLQDGSLLTATNLFTPNGMFALTARLRREQINNYQQQLDTLGKERKAAQAKGSGPTGKTSKAQQEIISDLDDRITLNKNCLDDQRTKVKETASQQTLARFSNDQISAFEITEKTFKLTAGRCSNHAMRALDDVGNVVLSLPYPELAPWLTAYGKTVLLNDGSAPPAERIYGQLLHGTLGGQTAITMLIEKQEENSIRGSYFYDRFRTPIELSGTLTGQTLELIELTEPKPGQSKKDTTLRLTQTASELRGQWASKAANKQFDVRLAP